MVALAQPRAVITPPITFRLRPEPRARLQLRVRIYATNALMDDAIFSEGGMRGADAAFVGNVNGRLFGDIFLSAACIDIGTVVHELGHAAIYWSRNVKGSQPMKPSGGLMVSQQEECFCETIETMMRQFANQAFKRGIWR